MKKCLHSLNCAGIEIVQIFNTSSDDGESDSKITVYNCVNTKSIVIFIVSVSQFIQVGNEQQRLVYASTRSMRRITAITFDYQHMCECIKCGILTILVFFLFIALFLSPSIRPFSFRCMRILSVFASYSKLNPQCAAISRSLAWGFLVFFFKNVI